jgi:hypothetical protein
MFRGVCVSEQRHDLCLSDVFGTLERFNTEV